MQNLVITAIAKDPRDDRHDHIQEFGGYCLQTKLAWRYPFDTAIGFALSGGTNFFVVSAQGTRIPVLLQRSRWGNWCLKTDQNGLLFDNLLNLPPLPSRGGLLNSLAWPRQGYGIGLQQTEPTNRLVALAAALKTY